MLTGHKIGIIVYTILIIMSLIVLMAIHTRAKKSSLLNYLTACQISVIIWLFLAIIENLSKETPIYLFVVQKVIIILYFYGPLWLLFTLEYIKNPGTKSSIWRWLIFLPAIATTLLTLINPDSPLIISRFDNGVREWGIVFLLSALLAFVYILISSFLILFNAVKKKKLVKENIMLVLSTLIPVIICILYYTENFRTPFNMMPVTLSVFIAVSAFLALRNKLFNVLPFAVHEVFYNINEAVLIIDLDGIVIDFNPALHNLFSPYFDMRSCKSITELGSNLSANISSQSDCRKVEEAFKNISQSYVVEFQACMQGSSKYITCSVYPFRNSAKRVIGSFLTFFDSTEYRRKTLKNERVRLSNDLHDSLGNSLNIISSNLEYVLNREEFKDEINECLQKSYDLTISLFLDLRRIVEELSPVDIENNGLIWALETMFGKLRNKGINIEFENYMSDMSLIDIYPYGEYIYFICQEAINNSITHGRAKNINITFNQSAVGIKIYISDDGAGCGKIIRNKGIRSMQLRVESLGGSMEYGSPSDGGFNIRILLPAGPRQPAAGIEEESHD